MTIPVSTPDLVPAAKIIAAAIDRHAEALRGLDSTFQKLGKTMHEELQAFLVRLDAATSAIAARLDALLKDQPLPDDIKAQLEKDISALEAMGKTPELPV